MNNVYIGGHVLDKEIIEARTILSSHSTPQEIKQAYAAHLEGLLAIVRATLSGEPTVRCSALTKGDLMKKDWWCADISQHSAQAFSDMGLEVYNQGEWTTEKTEWDYCRYALNRVIRTLVKGKKKDTK